MSSRCRDALCLLILVLAPLEDAVAQTPTTAPTTQRVLRVAADPNNLPFSNDKLEGFENKLAEMIAQELGARLEYDWRAQRRGFFRQTLKDGDAQLVLGVPAGFERALLTDPYYRSTYAMVYRPDRRDLEDLSSLDDPRLSGLKIGVQLIGADGANTPPAHALQHRGHIDNLIGFTVYGDYAQPNPPARIIEAVARGEVDVAMVWGPLAGYFAARQSPPLVVRPIADQRDASDLPLAFDICVGVRRSDKALRDEVGAILQRRSGDVRKLLEDFGVPIAVDPTLARRSQATSETEAAGREAHK
jgi:mxaJ protein